MNYNLVVRSAITICLFVLFISPSIGYSFPLSLKKAEKEAVDRAPELKALQAKRKSFEHSAIAAAQLSDPKLKLGSLNVPVDTFSFSQEPMTQVQVGLQQSLPRGRSLHYRSLKQKAFSKAESYKYNVMRLQILQGVRVSWLNLYYWVNAKQIVLNQKDVFQHLVSVTESMLANNKAQQKDVIRAQLELTELDNQLIKINQNISIAKAQLGRWISPQLAKGTVPKRLPRWPRFANIQELSGQLYHHPTLETDTAVIAANQAEVNVAKQQYKPGFLLGVAYGFRQGRNLDGNRRPDFFTAQVSMDLPLFTRNRQTQTLNASIENFSASKENKVSDYRQLLEVLKTQYATWEQEDESSRLYKSKLIPEAKQYAEATMTAYQNAQTDFPTLARAYVRELNVELSGLRVTVNRSIARANILYLQGQ